MVQMRCNKCGMYVEGNKPCNCGKCWIVTGIVFLILSIISFCASFTTYNHQYTYSTLIGVIIWICAVACCFKLCGGKARDRVMIVDQAPFIQDHIIIHQLPPSQQVILQQPPVQPIAYQPPPYIQQPPYQQPPTYQQPITYQQQQQVSAPTLAQQYQYPSEPLVEPVLENWNIPLLQNNNQDNLAQQNQYGKNI